MSKKRMMIELQAPETMREHRAEGFIVKGFACPVCSGNGWNFAKDADECSHDYVREPCKTCNGTGEVDAYVSVSWKASEERRIV